MVLMTLDHVRLFFYYSKFDPLDLTQSSIPLYLTRWITHICAPAFFFLAGIGIYVSLINGRPKRQLSQFLLIRAFLLLGMDLTLVRYGWRFDLGSIFSAAGVLWAIGWSLIVMAALIYLRTRIVAIIGLILIVGHNLFDNVQADQLGNIGWIWTILHERSMIEPISGFRMFILYPLIPWIGVMAIGYACGTLYGMAKERRLQFLRNIGSGAIITFIIIRAMNGYGDPYPWAIQSSSLYTFLSFINCQKYPPSFLFVAMTVGILLLLLYWFEKHQVWLLKPLIILGKQPLFYFITHIYLIHASYKLLSLFRAFVFSFLSTGYDLKYVVYNLPAVYIITILLTIFLYFICRLFSNYQNNHPGIRWLKYI